MTSAGLDRLPLDYIRAQGIRLCNARGVYSVPMAEWAVGGVLSLYKHLNRFSEQQKNRLWEKDRTVRELAGQTVCIVGAGNIDYARISVTADGTSLTVASADASQARAPIYGEHSCSAPATLGIAVSRLSSL